MDNANVGNIFALSQEDTIEGILLFFYSKNLYPGAEFMFEKIFENVRKINPLVHSITNYVTVNDCANILIACGASPLMADEPEEMKDIASISSALNINIGTLNERTTEAMLIAGKCSSKLNHPVILDPVGVGASQLRTRTVRKLLEEVKFTVIRGNFSEIKAIAGEVGTSKGVDANAGDVITEENLDDIVSFAKKLSEKIRAVIVITGAVDIVSDSRKAYCIRNGHPMMSSISGTGCMLSAMTAAFEAANPCEPLEAAAAAVITMGLAGETAYGRLKEADGNSSYRNYIIDAVYNMTGVSMEKGAKYEVR